MGLNFKGQRGRQDCNVSVTTNDGATYGSLPLYLEWVNHSPSGFEWGYYGSGPSQLAYAILHHYFVRSQGMTHQSAHKNAVDIYMTFKQDVIALIHGENWEISEPEIKIWLKHHTGG